MDNKESINPLSEHCIGLVPYFHTGLITRVKNPEPTCASNTCPRGQFAEDNASFNKFCTAGQPSSTCVHVCQVDDGVVCGRILIPGCLLTVLHRRGQIVFETSDDTSQTQRTLDHLNIHTNRQDREWCESLFSDQERVLWCAEKQIKTWLRPGPNPETWLLFRHSAIGRFAAQYLSSSLLEIPTDPAASSSSSTATRKDSEWLLVLPGVEPRLVGFWRNEYERLLGHTKLLNEASTSQAHMMLLTLGKCNFEKDFSSLADTTAAPTAAADGKSHDECAACKSNLARVICLPCVHLCYCITCATRAYTLTPGNVYPTGHPVPALGSKCPICSAFVTILIRVHRS